MVNKLKPKSEFSRNVLTLMTGTTIAQAIPIAISPILTRIYTPEDFGVFAIFMAISSIFGSISSARYEQAIMLPKKDEDAINIFALGLIINFIISLILFIIVIIFNTKFVEFINNKDIQIWLYFVPIVVFFTGIWNLLSQYNNRKKEYKDISNATIIKSIILAVVQLILGFLKQGAIGLISGQILSQMFANMKLLKNILKNRVLISKISKVKIIALAKKYKKFPIYNTQHAIINIFFSQIPIFILAKFFNNSIIGFYSLAIRIIQTPISILGNSLSRVLYQKITTLKNSKKLYMKTIYKFIKYQILISLFIFIVVWVFSNNINIIFGDSWVVVGDYIKILSPWLIMVFIVSPLAFSINLTNNQKTALKIEWFYGATKLSSLLLGSIYLKNIEMTLVIFSIANSIFLFFQALWFIKILKDFEKEIN